VSELTPKSGEKLIYALEGKGRGENETSLFEAKCFVLATGKFLGGGLRVSYRELGETLFSLPLFCNRTRGTLRYRAELPWMDRSFADEQPWATLGVRVDQGWRPVDGAGSPLFENLVACGSILAGADLAREGLGLGFAAYTGRECAGMVA
jgi:glycerol-3-phosphate dehydrogenase subunit B